MLPPPLKLLGGEGPGPPWPPLPTPMSLMDSVTEVSLAVGDEILDSVPEVSLAFAVTAPVDRNKTRAAGFS